MTESSDGTDQTPSVNGGVPDSAQTPSDASNAAAWLMKASGVIIALGGGGMGAYAVYWGVRKGSDDEMLIGGMVFMASLFGAAVTIGLASLLSAKR